MEFVANAVSEHPLIYVLVTLTCLYFVAIVIRRVYFHPLSKYPGPLLAKVSDLPRFLAVLRQRRSFEQYELLRQYGSPLRLGPNTVLFSDMNAITDILGQSSKPCLKDPASYDGLSATGEVNVLNATDRFYHARVRRLISHSFSAKSLLESESFFGDKIEEYLMAFESSGQSVDILQRTHHLFLDIVSQLSFGESFDCLSGKSPNAYDDVRAFFTVIPAFSFAPPLKYLPVMTFREALKGLARLQEFSRAHVGAYIHRDENQKRSSGPKGQFLQNLALAVDTETGTKLSREELVENAIIFLAAGSGTTASTIIYLIWECARHPEVKQRLIKEIRSKFPDPAVRPTYAEAAKLPFLDCVLKETLRLDGPLSGGAPRISPGKSIAGHYIPEGVQVEVNTYVTARNPDVFPDPDEFRPSRWESATDANLDAMNNMARPFSYGPRNCVGRHLAELGLVLTIARLYQLYDLTLGPEMAHEDMRQIDLGVLEPACKRFCVVASARSKGNG